VERVLVWGGGAVVCFVAGSSGAHPAVAAALGVTGAILIAAVLTAAATT
jgi:hypothetical protein